MFTIFLLDMLEAKKFGIFSLLDEECQMPVPRIKSFMQNVATVHEKCSTISSCVYNYEQYSFIIQHFGKKVLYSTVRQSLNSD